MESNEQNRNRGTDTGNRLTAVKRGGVGGLDERRLNDQPKNIGMTHRCRQLCSHGQRGSGQGPGGGGQRGEKWGHVLTASAVKIKFLKIQK